MEKIEVIQHWSYFCSLAERLDETKHYIYHGLVEIDGNIELVHGNVYSDIFKQIIVLSASEFEVISKALSKTKGKSPKKITGISKTILSEFPKITTFEVSTPYMVNKPLSEWRIEEGKVLGLDWWKAYNSLKHSGESSYQLATLENAVLALEALYIVNLYLIEILFESMDIVYTYPNIYFKCKYLPYPASVGEGRLPDFGDMTPMERIHNEYPTLFDDK